MSEKLNEFKKDLKALLLKHEAEMEFMGDGDTHGIHGEGLGVCFRTASNGWTTHRLSNSYGLDSHDLDETL